jgi:hypothetical protein
MPSRLSAGKLDLVALFGQFRLDGFAMISLYDNDPAFYRTAGTAAALQSGGNLFEVDLSGIETVNSADGLAFSPLGFTLDSNGAVDFNIARLR